MSVNRNKEINKIAKCIFCEIKIIYAAMINFCIAGKIICSTRKNNTKQIEFILFLVEYLRYYSYDQFINTLFNLYHHNGGHKSLFEQLKKSLSQMNLNVNEKYFEKSYPINVDYHNVKGVRCRIIPKGFHPYLHALNVPFIRNNETAHRNISDKCLQNIELQHEKYKRTFTFWDAYLIFDKTWKNFRNILKIIKQKRMCNSINFDEFINWEHEPFKNLNEFINSYSKAYTKFLKGMKKK